LLLPLLPAWFWLADLNAASGAAAAAAAAAAATVRL
jgi:hypothetical protein